RRGGEWLPGHPDHELIARRYLRYGGLARQALARLAETADDPDTIDGLNDRAEETVERPLSLNQQRHDAVMGAVVAAGGGKVVDLGCGEGRLLSRLLTEPSVVDVLGVDVSIRALERAERRLRLDELSERRRERIRLVQGALTYRDHRLDGFDVAVVMEVIEHIDPERLDVFAQVLFEQAGPRTVIVTTPNREYNVHFDRLDPVKLRHGDHRFEWDRDQMAAWAADISDRYDYRVAHSGIGPDDSATGPPTQMVVFSR
ncbi:MAG: methyltransferase domain-containing protein, partial [Actinomycetia bacterium]|nr:methyltransferase domain-containing protein [Actinomycetes bacterium]